MKKILLAIFIFLALCVVLAVGGFFYVCYQIGTPMAVVGENRQVVIESGLSIKQIAAKLEDNGLINSAFYFEIYVWFEGIDNLQAGEYELSPTMAIPEIAAVLSNGWVNRNEVKVTIPEGFTVKEIDARLAATGLIRSGEFSGVARLKMEGYIFPDTYNFDKDATVQDIVQKMFDNFNRKVKPEMRAEIERQGKTLNDVIIFASIVQQEANSNEEMPKIAGVFQNRLDIGMALQSDPTVNYVTGKGLRQITLEDTQLDSPYNTYKYKGLPPGPICNPGLDAIRAAISPEEHDFFYFLHPLEAPTVFSKTLEEHNINKAKWLR